MPLDCACLLIGRTWNLCGLAGMDFEASFRMFLESFRLPGEAQKIARVMEAFGAEYYRQCPDVFHDADVVYVLAYSTILLNTDQHNPGVRTPLFLCAADDSPLNGGEHWL